MTSLNDILLPFEVEGADVRGRLVRLGPAFAKTLASHDYPSLIGEQVGEGMALAATLAGALKYEGIFSLQVQGDGAIRAMVNDVTSAGHMRGYTRYDEDALKVAEKNTDAAPLSRLYGKGHLAFTVDQGTYTERYQGLVELAGQNLSDCAEAYFMRSEQLQTAIVLAARVDGEPGAAALMIQRMPGAVSNNQLPDTIDEAEETWNRVRIMMKSVKAEELLDPDLSNEDLLLRLFHEDGVRVYESKSLEHKCRCSREKVVSTLKSFPKDEVLDLIVDGSVEVKCEFCNSTYNFDEKEVNALHGA
jgi:molecular chaperone Hsp33